MTTVTLADVLSLALPAGTRVLAGADRLLVSVSWACTMRPSIPAFPSLEGGEIAFVPLADLVHLGEQVTLHRLISDLSAAGVVAIAVLGDVPEETVAHAQKARMPLLQLPPGVNLNAIERTVIRLIVDRQAQIERFGAEVSHKLAQVAVENQGWSGLAETLARLSRKAVVLQDAAFGLLAQATVPDSPVPALPLQPGEPPLVSWLHHLPPRGTTAPTNQWVLPDGHVRVVSIMLAEGQPAGYLSLLGAAAEFTAADLVIAERGALAGAVELAKERAFSAAEAQLRQQFWSDLLAGKGASSGVLARQAARWGIDLNAKHLIMGLGAADGLLPLQRDRLVHRLESALSAERWHGLAIGYGDKVFALLAVRNGRSEAGAVSMLVDSLAKTMPGVAFAGGMSQPANDADGYRRAIEEAEMALSLALLSPEKRVVSASELGVYRLLLPLRGSRTLQAFFEDTLGAVVAYDRENGTELLQTLESYFAVGGNLRRAAEALYLHRNSLLYRMERIATITGLNLDDAEDRLRVQLALKVRRLLA